jgi:restriction system protein
MNNTGSNPLASFDFVWSLARALWPLLLVLAAVKLLPLIPAVLRNRRLAASGIADIDAMDGKTFEDCLGALFSRLGYKVEVTPYRGDWGADLVLVSAGVRTVVQAKRYRKAVGVRAVQEAVAAKAKYRCSEAMVVTNATFTRQAVELARVNGVMLWDRDKLVEKLLNDRKAQDQKYG